MPRPPVPRAGWGKLGPLEVAAQPEPRRCMSRMTGVHLGIFLLVAPRFDISIRHAQKYASVWKVFFARAEESESVNIDAILLDEPSWCVVAVTETNKLEEWLAYAQDRKAADPRYSLVAFWRDNVIARVDRGIADTMEMREAGVELPELKPSWACPWVKLLCMRTGRPIPFRQCEDCGFRGKEFCETNPTASEV